MLGSRSHQEDSKKKRDAGASSRLHQKFPAASLGNHEAVQ